MALVVKITCLLQLFGVVGASVVENMPEVIERSPMVGSLLEMAKQAPSTAETSNAAFWSVVFYAPCVLLAALIYKHYLKTDTSRESMSEKDLEEAKSEFKEGQWSSGLFDCWRGRKDDIYIFCCALQFPFIRWADTVHAANLVHFYGALGMILGLYALSALFTGKGSAWGGPPASGGVALLMLCLCVFFRHRLRKRCDLPANAETVATDCLSWMCCAPCAIAQEARQVEVTIAKEALDPKMEPLTTEQILAPPTTTKKHNIKLTIFGAKGLPVGDMFTSDPYCVCEYTPKGGEKTKLFETEVITRTLDPVWKDQNKKMVAIGEGDVFTFKVYDKNRVLLDEELCSASLEIIRVVEHFDREINLEGGSRLRATLRVQYEVLH